MKENGDFGQKFTHFCSKNPFLRSKWVIFGPISMHYREKTETTESRRVKRVRVKNVKLWYIFGEIIKKHSKMPKNQPFY